MDLGTLRFPSNSCLYIAGGVHLKVTDTEVSGDIRLRFFKNSNTAVHVCLSIFGSECAPVDTGGISFVVCVINIHSETAPGTTETSVEIAQGCDGCITLPYRCLEHGKSDTVLQLYVFGRLSTSILPKPPCSVLVGDHPALGQPGAG